MRTRPLSIALLALIVGTLFTRPADAASISVALGGSGYLCQQSLFPTNCAASPTYQWVNGDFVGQDVQDSGLNSIDAVDLSLKYDDLLVAGQSQTYDVVINGITIGSFSIDGVGDGLDRVVSSLYTFAPIAGPDYEVLFVVASSTTPNGLGSVGWFNGPESDSSFDLVSTVPEPGTLMLTGLGLAMVARRVRRARTSDRVGC